MPESSDIQNPLYIVGINPLGLWPPPPRCKQWDRWSTGKRRPWHWWEEVPPLFRLHAHAWKVRNPEIHVKNGERSEQVAWITYIYGCVKLYIYIYILKKKKYIYIWVNKIMGYSYKHVYFVMMIYKWLIIPRYSKWTCDSILVLSSIGCSWWLQSYTSCFGEYQWPHYLSATIKTLTFHCTGCLMGILLVMVLWKTPHDQAVQSPIYIYIP